MSDKREFNKMNEQELKQVAGGGWGDIKDTKHLYRCPVCGNEQWETITLGSPRPVCRVCRQNGQEVKMTQIG